MAFSHYVVFRPLYKNDFNRALNVLIDNRIAKFGTPISWVT